MSDGANWCLIESDPGVFTALLKEFGATGLECEEVYDLDHLEDVSDAYGFIFLFKIEDKNVVDGKPVTDARKMTIFFANQVIRNACATLAILNVIMNLEEKDFKLGETLSNFKSFVVDFDSQMKGTALGGSEVLSNVHNSFSNQNIFSLEDKLAKPDEDVYHFVGYVPIDKIIYELDGLKPSPIEHDEIPAGKPWVEVIKPILSKRMGRCVDGNFNLMAIVPNRLEKYTKQLEELKAKSGNAELVKQLEKSIEDEKNKELTQKCENLRRRHNYLPFIVELLKIAAENKKLVGLVEGAEKISKEKIEKHIAANG